MLFNFALLKEMGFLTTYNCINDLAYNNPEIADQLDDLIKIIREDLDERLELEYDSGYGNGHSEGYDEGYSDAEFSHEGDSVEEYNRGYSDGYDEGMKDFL